jgi:hypothetical protein
VSSPTNTHNCRPWSALALGVLFVLIAGAGIANAQTVIVTNAPANANVELFFNSDRVATATADTDGQATLTFSLPATTSETTTRVVTDRCGERRRVLLVERGVQMPPLTEACDRREVAGFFATRRATTFVVDMAQPDPVVNLRQGPVPSTWLAHGGIPEGGGVNLPPASTGLMVFAGAGFAASSDAGTVACGDVSQCTTDAANRTVSVGLGYWKGLIGVQASYVKPNDVGSTGSGDGFSFNSTRRTDLFVLSGGIGAPIGGVRIYGRGGVDYHRATLTTNNTIGDATQTLELKTAGWGWVAAGGVEVWLKPAIAFYADGGLAKLKGGAIGGAEGALDDSLIFVLVGARVRITR